MNIAENIAFGLKIKNKSKSYIDDKIKYALKLVNLDGYEKKNAKPVIRWAAAADRHCACDRQ